MKASHASFAAPLALLSLALGSAGQTGKVTVLMKEAPAEFPGNHTLTFDTPGVVNAFVTAPVVPATITVTSGRPTAASFVVTSAR